MDVEARKQDMSYNEENIKVDVLAAGKQNQDSPKHQHVKDTKPVIENLGSNSAELSVPDTTPTTSEANPDAGSALGRTRRELPETLERWHQKVGIENVANEMAAVIKRHCVLTDEEVNAVVLWIIATYLMNKFRIFPKLSLISPEKRCGKTTTMDVISGFCRDGLMASSVSPAALFRLTAELDLTLLIDEADTFVKNGDPALVGLINSGHSQSGAQVIRCQGENFTPKVYSTWMPMVLASIGDLPHTIMDRSIVVNLRRKKSDEYVQAIPADYHDHCKSIRRQILTWCEDNAKAIGNSPKQPPSWGNDRAADNWLPLFTVAARIGGEWPQKCESAYRAMDVEVEQELPTQLLAAIRQLFRETGISRISSAELVEHLCQDVSGPWSSCNGGKRLSPNQTAQLLRPYGIKPKTHRFDGGTLRGYDKSQFEDAFDRYLRAA